jgi:protein pelota
MDKFYEVMQKNENRVTYGEKEVLRCLSLKAIDTLLISDHLFRSKDFKKRKIYNDLVDSVKRMKGIVVIFSSLHPSGEKLKNITGIAAILKYDVVPLDEEEEE